MRNFKGKDSPTSAETLSDAFNFAFPNSQARDKAKDMFKSVMTFSAALKNRSNRTEVVKSKLEVHEEGYEQRKSDFKKHDHESALSHHDQGKKNTKDKKHQKKPDAKHEAKPEVKK